MAVKWITALPGIRYYESASRRLKSNRPDRYFALRYSVDGKQREEGLGWASEGWTPDKAQAVLAKLKEAVRIGIGPRSIAELREVNRQRELAENDLTKTMSVAQFFDEIYLPAAQKRKRTWSHDKGRFDKGIRPRLGDIPFRALTKVHLEELMASLRVEDRLSEATILQYMAVMRQMFNLARITMLNGIPLWQSAISPIKEVTLPHGSETRERFLEYDEADQLVAAAASLQEERSLVNDLVDLIRLALNTGLRFGELMRLEWADISLRHATLTVRVEAHRKPGGHVPLNAEAVEILRERISRRKKDDCRVFPPERTGKDGSILHRVYEEAVHVCGFNHEATSTRDRVVFHTLRHTFGSWLALAGTDIYRIKTLMRHKTITMTMRYAHLLPDATRDAVNHLRPSQSAHVLDALDTKASHKPDNQ